MVEHLKVLISRAPKGPYGRAPPVLMVEQLKFQFTYWVGGANSRAPAGPMVEQEIPPIPFSQVMGAINSMDLFASQ